MSETATRNEETGATNGAPPPTPAAGRYVLLDEIARGGMGTVYRATDTVLGREVAVKVLQERFGPDSAAARRFIDEARIAGQLQHPGVPAVHDLGALPDGRPFLAMKLIKGRTLDELLRDRADPAADRGRLVAVFEQVCQAVGYAHAHDVIHRDLKPANVMVGAFGEVQVMDWGLAKVLTSGERERPEADPLATTAENAIRSARDVDSATQAGSVLGTPAYMPPEQAIGAVDQIDRRSDVFGLGALLCAVLTGQPPYLGADSESTRQLAARSKLDDAFGRLDACGAEPELVALCKRCLAAEKADRPADAGNVATAVASLRAAADERAKRAELDRARAEAEAREQRKRRRLQIGLAGCVLVLVCVSGFGAWWLQYQAAERDRQESARRLEKVREQERAETAAASALARTADLAGQGLWSQAEDTLGAVIRALPPDLSPELSDRLVAARSDLRFAARLERIRFDGASMRNRDEGITATLEAYKTAFAERGFVPDAGDEADLIRRVRDDPLREQIVVALDDMWYLASTWSPAFNELRDLRERLWRLVIGVTGQVWRREIIDGWFDAARFEAAVGEARPEQLSPAILVALALQLHRLGQDGSALVREAAVRRPSDVWLHLHAAYFYIQRDQRDKVVEHYRAAVALRPNAAPIWMMLGHALRSKGDRAGAAAAHREAIRLAPEDGGAWVSLGFVYEDQKDWDAAIDAYRRALRLQPPNGWTFMHLGRALAGKGDFVESEKCFRRSIELEPDLTSAHFEMGQMYEKRGNLTEAVRCYKEAVRRDPNQPVFKSRLAAAEKQLLESAPASGEVKRP